MKHIKFKAEAVAPNFQQVNVTILEQTHRGSEFGNVVGSPQRFIHEGYTLASAAFPEILRGCTKTIVRGTNKRYDNEVLTFTVAEYAKFKAAVEAYNKEFADKTDVCAVIVG